MNLKRITDLTIIIILSPFLFIIILLVSILVRFKLGKPVFFKQVRIGHLEKEFEIIKFRSMKNSSIGSLISDEDRLCSFGKWLRATSLDEFPAILCVLKGQMSLVGPRPLLPEYLELYSTEQRLRHSVLPGITGWAQVNGRNSISWDEKFKLDLWYVNNANIFTDINILIKTLFAVVIRRGISATGNATMPPFRGNN